MEPEKNTGPEIMGEPEKKEVKKPPLPVKAVFWITVVLLAALAVMIVLLLVAEDTEKVAGIFVVVIFVFAIVNRACWKCPACRKHLGRFGYPRTCPHCGEDLKM